MILSDINDLTKGSHKKVEVECDSKNTSKCSFRHLITYKDYIQNTIRNNGKYICFYCSRNLKYSGRNNPNCQYKNLDDNYLSNIDTDEKAYILGFIASDGSINNNSIRISIHKKDLDCLKKIKDNICEDLHIKQYKNNMIDLTINSKKIVKDCCDYLKINPGKKSYKIRFPELRTDELKWSFLRGYFDGDGGITTEFSKERYPECNIYSSSKIMLKEISNFVKIKHHISKNRIEWSGNNCLDFLGKLYDDASIFMKRKKDQYLMWSNWVPSLSGYDMGGYIDDIKWAKTRKDAIKPFKVRVSDSGYDLSLLEKIKENGNYHTYSTGIKVTPPYGWYLDMVPRSSIIKYGYILANSVGIIDRQYVGEVLVVLYKIDNSKANPELPARLVQLIPRPIVHFNLKEVDSLDVTERGEKGFGSSDANTK